MNVYNTLLGLLVGLSLFDKVDSNHSDNYYTKCMNSKLYPNRKQGWKNV